MWACILLLSNQCISSVCVTHSSTCLDFVSVGGPGVMYEGGGGERGGDGEESTCRALTGFVVSSELLAL